MTQNQFRGFPLSVVQRFTKQILKALVTMEEARIIHCDLKPENILLVPVPAKHTHDKIPVTNSSNIRSKNSAWTDAYSNKNRTAANEQSSSATSMLEGQGENSNDKVSPPGSDKKPGQLSEIKVIDFGSACFEGCTVYSYIQSRFCKLPT